MAPVSVFVGTWLAKSVTAGGGRQAKDAILWVGTRRAPRARLTTMRMRLGDPRRARAGFSVLLLCVVSVRQHLGMAQERAAEAALLDEERQRRAAPEVTPA